MCFRLCSYGRCSSKCDFNNKFNQKNNQNLITVFVRGRDKLKRPLMTRVAYDLSSKIILTSDNPRNEPIDEIISDMLKGIENDDHAKVLIINDRETSYQNSFYYCSNFRYHINCWKGT